MNEEKERKVSTRKRLSPREREKMILDEATLFFADHGFEGTTRDLAERLGISQGLLYRYYKDKNNLVERVYERTFLQRWNPDWVNILSDRSQSVEARLLNFYRSYVRTIDDYVWIRIAMYSGLAGNNLTYRYLHNHVEELLKVIVKEIRFAKGEPEGPVEYFDIEQVWVLHSAFIHYIIRKHIYGTSVTEDIDDMINHNVHGFLYGYMGTAKP